MHLFIPCLYHWVDLWPSFHAIQSRLKFHSALLCPQPTGKANLAFLSRTGVKVPPVCRGLAVHTVEANHPWDPSSQLPAVPCGQGCFWVLPEVLLQALVVLKLPPDARKLSLQVSVARGNRRRSLILTTLPEGPRLKGGGPGAGSGLSVCAARPQVHTCSFRARPKLGACEVSRKEQAGVGETG